MFDVIIAGGGPAGLSAALVLGRCRRKVLVIDAGEPRNAASKAMHGFLSRDGMSPAEFLKVGRTQLAKYPCVEFRRGRVTRAERAENQFTVFVENGGRFTSRILLLATGLKDELPAIPGFDKFWGASVHLCPYCDGWEHRDQPMVVHGRGTDGAELALEMLGWSAQITYCTGGLSELPREQRERLVKRGVSIDERRIKMLEGIGDQLERVRFDDGAAIECRALFFSSPQQQRCELGRELGCEFADDKCTILCNQYAATNVPGLYAAGNASCGLQLVIMAAAEGTQAAFSINQALLEADVTQARDADGEPATTS